MRAGLPCLGSASLLGKGTERFGDSPVRLQPKSDTTKRGYCPPSARDSRMLSDFRSLGKKSLYEKIIENKSEEVNVTFLLTSISSSFIMTQSNFKMHHCVKGWSYLCAMLLLLRWSKASRSWVRSSRQVCWEGRWWVRYSLRLVSYL